MANSKDGEQPPIVEPPLPALPEPSSPSSLLPPPTASETHELFVERERPPYIAGTIDVAAFVKAQSAFVREQSFFLREGRLNEGTEYEYNLTQYSKAQDDYIQAMHQILEQLGVM
jgi:hypothetical protein